MVSRRRQKVGLTRMHAAVDAMRPMGFSPALVRKRVKQLLKVYGDDGWVFIEDAAYKQLIDTLLDEPEPELVLEEVPEIPRLDLVPEKTPSQGCSGAANEHDTFDEDNSITIGKNQEKLDAVVSSVHMKAVPPKFGFASTDTPEAQDTVRRSRNLKPCYGWISDDDEDEDDIPQVDERKPCYHYGWITDDENDDDMVEFDPKIEYAVA